MGASGLKRRSPRSAPYSQGTWIGQQRSTVPESEGRRWWCEFSWMKVDPRVAHRKYDEEFARLVDQRLTLEERGLFLLCSSSYPRIDVFCAPRHPLRVSVPASQTGGGLVLPQ